MITLWAKLEQGQGSKIRQKIRLDVNRCCRDVKQVLHDAYIANKFTNFRVHTKVDAIADIISR